jgi:MYXO-CTERM domain-containing protein
MQKLTIITALLSASVCASANTTFNLNNVQFTDGATATGSFTINTALNALVSWSINVTGSSLSPTANYNYTSSPSDSSSFNISSTEIAVAATPFAQDLVLLFNSSLGGGGTINLVAGSVDCNAPGGSGNLQSGSVSVATPEPASLLLALPMLALFAAILHRRKRLTA